MSAKAVVGVVDTAVLAEKAIANLKEAGFEASDISVLMAQANGEGVHASNAAEGAAVGAGAGSVFGGALGILAGIGAIAIPGIGPLIAAGPILAALAGLAAGAAAGVVGGTLVGYGIPEVEAKIYESKIANGHVLVAVHTTDAVKSKVAQMILLENGGVSVSAVTEASVPRRTHA